MVQPCRFTTVFLKRILVPGVVLALLLVGASHRLTASASSGKPQPLNQLSFVLTVGRGHDLLSLDAVQTSPSDYDATGTIKRLPCPGRTYLVRAGFNSLTSSDSSEYHGAIKVKHARLPRGIRCNLPLPAKAGVTSTRLTFTPIQSNKALMTVTGRRLAAGDEFVGKLIFLNGLAPGDYRITGSFRSPHRTLVLRYLVRVYNR